MRGLTIAEIRNAARSLSRSPTVTVCAVLCLALGIGATSALSSAISRALLKPLPFRQPDRLVAVHRITPQSGPMGGWSQSVPNYLDLATRSKQIQGLAAITWGSALINLPTEAIQASQHLVTGNIFSTLGVTAQRGRLIEPDDDRLDAPMVAVLSDEFWRTRLGSDPSIVNRTVSINGVPTVVIGIAPRDFRIPLGQNILRADVWSPIRFTPDQLAQRRRNSLLTFGRLTSGATPASAERELRGIFANLVRAYPQLTGDNVRVAALQTESVQSVRRPLLMLFGAVCMVLLIAATNVAALLLARGVQRQREMAVRTALGASGWDAMRPVLLESMLIAAVSAVIGIAIASLGVRTIGALAASRLPQLDGLNLDFGVLMFALALSIIVAVVAGIAPAVRAARVDPQDALRGGRGGGTRREQHRALRSLVILEISLSLILLIGAGLVLKAFAKLLSNDPGFDAARIVTLQVSTSSTRYPDQTTVQRFLEPALTAIEAVPGVEAAATISALPYETWGNNSSIRYEGQPAVDDTHLPIVEQREVTPGFFSVTKQRLISGRLLLPTDDDTPNRPRVVVVNQALVKRDFHGTDPVGKRIVWSASPSVTIVGVVSNIRNAGPIGDPEPEMYWNYRQSSPGWSAFTLMIRVRGGDPASVVPGVRTAIRGVDRLAAVGSVATMPDVIEKSLGRPKFYFELLSAFAGLAIVLAVAGLYGVLSYAVAQRTREMGIRTALGSSRGAIVRLVALDGLLLVATGVLVGVAGGVAATRLMGAMLYGVSPLDTATWVGAIAVMILSAMTAAMVPAWRAAQVDPQVAMQVE